MTGKAYRTLKLAEMSQVLCSVKIFGQNLVRRMIESFMRSSVSAKSNIFTE